MSPEDRSLLLAALDAYAAEHPSPDVTDEIRGIAAERNHNDTWTHVACMIAALRELGVLP